MDEVKKQKWIETHCKRGVHWKGTNRKVLEIKDAGTKYETRITEETCELCGAVYHVEEAPYLLSDFFSIPAKITRVNKK